VRAGRTTLESAKHYAADVEELVKKARSAGTPGIAETPAAKPVVQPTAASKDLLSRTGAFLRRKN
jgi:hypothetical protein